MKEEDGKDVILQPVGSGARLVVAWGCRRCARGASPGIRRATENGLSLRGRRWEALAPRPLYEENRASWFQADFPHPYARAPL